MLEKLAVSAFDFHIAFTLKPADPEHCTDCRLTASIRTHIILAVEEALDRQPEVTLVTPDRRHLATLHRDENGDLARKEPATDIELEDMARAREVQEPHPTGRYVPDATRYRI